MKTKELNNRLKWLINYHEKGIESESNMYIKKGVLKDIEKLKTLLKQPEEKRNEPLHT